MKKEKNSAEVWDNVWKNKNSLEKNVHSFNRKQKTILWNRMKKILINKFGTLNGIKTIEIGSGSGLTSLVLSNEGAYSVLLDYSPKAIDYAKLLFRHNNTNAKFIQQDALNIDKNLLGKFDVSISSGTAEHFTGENRIKFIKTHLDVLKDGGISLIAVPNKWCVQYRIHKFLSELFGRWSYGEERPFSIIEFKKVFRDLGYKVEFIGGYFFTDPFLIKKRIKKLFRVKDNFDINNIKKEIGTPLDKYFSREIVAIVYKMKEIEKGDLTWKNHVGKLLDIWR